MDQTVYQPTPEEVRDVIADASRDKLRVGAKYLGVVPIDQIVEKLLGFDPTRGKNTRPDFGGRSKDAWFNEHLSMSTLRKILGELIDEGVIVKLSKPNFRNENDLTARRMTLAVTFPYQVRTGYVLLEDYNEALDNVDADRRNTQREKIMKQARSLIAEKYAKQVETVYQRLCSEAGIDPAVEGHQ